MGQGGVPPPTSPQSFVQDLHLGLPFMQRLELRFASIGAEVSGVIDGRRETRFRQSSLTPGWWETRGCLPRVVPPSSPNDSGASALERGSAQLTHKGMRHPPVTSSIAEKTSNSPTPAKWESNRVHFSEQDICLHY